MDKAAKHAYRILLINTLLNEIKMLLKCDPELTDVLVNFQLKQVEDRKYGHLNCKLKGNERIYKNRN